MASGETKVLPLERDGDGHEITCAVMAISAKVGSLNSLFLEKIHALNRTFSIASTPGHGVCAMGRAGPRIEPESLIDGKNLRELGG